MKENIKNVALMVGIKFLIALSFASNLITWPIQIIYLIIKYQYKKSKGQEELNNWLEYNCKLWEKIKIVWRATFCIWNYDDFISELWSIDEE